MEKIEIVLLLIWNGENNTKINIFPQSFLLYFSLLLKNVFDFSFYIICSIVTEQMGTICVGFDDVSLVCPTLDWYLQQLFRLNPCIILLTVMEN